MLNAPVAAVKPKEAPFFTSRRRHIFRLAELNAFILLRSEKIK